MSQHNVPRGRLIFSTGILQTNLVFGLNKTNFPQQFRAVQKYGRSHSNLATGKLKFEQSYKTFHAHVNYDLFYEQIH